MPWIDQNGNVYITSGNVGVGTTTPAYKLQVVGAQQDAAQTVLDVRAPNAAGEFKAFDVVLNAGVPEVLLRTGSVGAGTRLSLAAESATPALTITTAGQVGIGTTNPLYRLEVVGDSIRIDAGRGLLWNNLGQNLGQVVYDASNVMRFVTDNQTRVTIDADGKVGIGTTGPNAKLGIQGAQQDAAQTLLDIRANNAAGQAKALGVVVNAGIPEVLIRTAAVGSGPRLSLAADSATPHLTITPAGNVGIGTPSPGAGFKLDVAGNINASGNITAGAAGDMAVVSGRKVFLDGLNGTRYIAADPSQDSINVGGKFELEPAADLGLSIDQDGTIKTNGNLQVLRTDPNRVPVVWHLGRQGFHYTDPPQNQNPTVPLHTNYFFWQDRLNQNGWYWGGWNTFRHPLTVKKDPNNKDPSVEWGYGYYAFRNMAKNYLLEADGKIVTDNEFYGPIIYFQNPEHIDVIGEVVDPNQQPPRDVAFKTRPPSGYDSDRHPYLDLGSGSSLVAAVSPGATQITVQPGHPFTADDEIFIDEQSTPPKSEINEVLSVSGDALTLKRDVKGYSSGKPVRKVRELGAVQPDRSTTGLAVNIRRSGDDLVFKDNRGSEITLQQIRQLLP